MLILSFEIPVLKSSCLLNSSYWCTALQPCFSEPFFGNTPVRTMKNDWNK